MVEWNTGMTLLFLSFEAVLGVCNGSESLVPESGSSKFILAVCQYNRTN